LPTDAAGADPADRRELVGDQRAAAPARRRPGPPVARREDAPLRRRLRLDPRVRRRGGARYAAPLTVSTTRPTFAPASMCRWASATASSENVESTSGRSA